MCVSDIEMFSHPYFQLPPFHSSFYIFNEVVICFNNYFAAGNAYANCDASTVAPVLNVNDFTCFLNKYAAGCP